MACETANQKLARLIIENPDLPIKVMVDGMLASDVFEWCVGELNDCEVTEYTNYEPDESYYFGRDDDDLFERMRDEIWCRKRDEIYDSLTGFSENGLLNRCTMASVLTGEAFPDGVLDCLVREVIDALDWKPCILIEVGP